MVPLREQQASGNIHVLREAPRWRIGGATAANFRPRAFVQSNPSKRRFHPPAQRPHQADELGYGRAYRYAHDEPETYAAGERYFPDDIEEQTWCQLTPRGVEAKIAQKQAHLQKLHDETGKG